MWFDVVDGPLTVVHAYLTTSRLAENSALPIPAFTDDVIALARTRVSELLNDAVECATSGGLRPFHVVLHIQTPCPHAFGNEIRDEDLGVRVFPTAIVPSPDGNRNHVSAIVLRVPALSWTEAKGRAEERLAEFAALCTLILSSRFEAARSLHWPAGHPPLVEVDSLDIPITGRLLPPNEEVCQSPGCPPALLDTLVTSMRAFVALTPPDMDRFRNALFAFSAGHELFGSHGALSIVALIAGLGALLEEHATRCPGDVQCSRHGTLPFRHPLAGEAQQITELARRTLRLESGDLNWTRVSDVIRNTYQTQRSAYVHDAVRRIVESPGCLDFFVAMPSEDSATGPQLDDRQYHASLLRLARLVLLGWLADHAGESRFRAALVPVDRGFLVQMPVHGQATVPALSEIRVAP